MGDATTLLFGLEGFRVLSVSREHDDRSGDDVREVVVEGLEQEQACPDCGVLPGRCTPASSAGSRTCRMGVRRCGCGGTRAGGPAGSGPAGGGRSLRPAGRSGWASV